MLLTALLLVSSINVESAARIEVKIINTDGSPGKGAAVVIGHNRILTAGHVLSNIMLATATCDGKDIPLKIVAISDSVDLAVADLTENCSVQPIKLAQSNPKLTAEMFLVGCPAGMCFIVTSGIVSGFSKNPAGAATMWSDAKSWFGNSGGPALDTNGHLIGIASAMKVFSRIEISSYEAEVNSQNYAAIVPLSEIKKFLATIK